MTSGVIAVAALLGACSDAGAPAARATDEATAEAVLETSAVATVSPLDGLTSDVWFVEDGERWARSLRASTTSTVGPRLAVMPDGSIVVGLTLGYHEGPADADLGGGRLGGVGRYDIVVGRFTASGEHLWSRVFGDAAADFVGDIDVTVDGSIVVAGTFEETLDLDGLSLRSAGDRDAFIAMLDEHGEARWARSFGGPGRDSGARAAALDDGGLILAGSFDGEVDVGTGLLVGSEPQHPANHEVFALRLDALGAVEWAIAPGVSGWASDLEVAAPAGEIVLVATRRIDAVTTTRPLASRVMRLSAVGDVLWTRLFDQAGAAAVSEVAVASDGGVVLVGSFEGPVDLGGGEVVPEGWGHPVIASEPDAFVAKLSADGEHVWSRTFGSNSSERAEAVAATAEGDVLVSGVLDWAFDLAAGIEVRVPDGAPNGGTFIARFDADGVPVAAVGPPAAPAGYRLDRLVMDPAAPGTILVGGRFFDAIDFGFGRLRTSVWWDFFIGRIDAP